MCEGKVLGLVWVWLCTLPEEQHKAQQPPQRKQAMRQHFLALVRLARLMLVMALAYSVWGMGEDWQR